MSTTCLIYPCLISEQQFSIINQIYCTLNNLRNDYHQAQKTIVKLKYVDLESILCDLTELKCNSFKQGFRFNSYILNITIIKIGYILELLKIHDNLFTNQLTISISMIFNDLESILDQTRSEFIES